MTKEAMAIKQKKPIKKDKNKFLRPGTLAQFCNNKTASRSCSDIGKKRVVVDTKKEKLETLLLQKEPMCNKFSYNSPEKISHTMEECSDGNRQNKLPRTPRTPQSAEFDSQSRLESLPMELLVKIMCHLHHDQLRAVFHVSQRIRNAVLQAIQCHFNYTTPVRSGQEMLRTDIPLPSLKWPFISEGESKGAFLSNTPCAPRAPRHAPRPPRKSIDKKVLKQISAVLFPETSIFPSKIVVSGLSGSDWKSMVSNCVLEEELCHAVTQNKLC